ADFPEALSDLKRATAANAGSHVILRVFPSLGSDHARRPDPCRPFGFVWLAFLLTSSRLLPIVVWLTFRGFPVFRRSTSNGTYVYVQPASSDEGNSRMPCGGSIMAWFCRIGLAAIHLLLCAALKPAVAETKRVMLLHSFGQDFKPWSEYAGTI